MPSLSQHGGRPYGSGGSAQSGSHSSCPAPEPMSLASGGRRGSDGDNQTGRQGGRPPGSLAAAGTAAAGQLEGEPASPWWKPCEVAGAARMGTLRRRRERCARRAAAAATAARERALCMLLLSDLAALGAAVVGRGVEPAQGASPERCRRWSCALSSHDVPDAASIGCSCDCSCRAPCSARWRGSGCSLHPTRLAGGRGERSIDLECAARDLTCRLAWPHNSRAATAATAATAAAAAAAATRPPVAASMSSPCRHLHAPRRPSTTDACSMRQQHESSWDARHAGGPSAAALVTAAAVQPPCCPTHPPSCAT